MTLLDQIKRFGKGEEIGIAIEHAESWEKEYRTDNKQLFDAAANANRPNVYNTACAIYCLKRAEEQNNSKH